MPPMRKFGKNMLNLTITNEEMLYQSYLPFLKQGGLFIKTDKRYNLGDDVFLLLQWPDGEKKPVAGQVAWINPKGAQGGRPPGIGVHFSEQDKGQTREKIEAMLTSQLKSDKKTHTM
jgi:type IV pilus assembly protein PilZ